MIVVFAQAQYVGADGFRRKHYYVAESVGIACGLLLAALHVAGLAALVHTPSPMRFLTEVLQRPAHERPYVVIPVGWPATDAIVPDLQRKPLDEVLVHVPPATAPENLPNDRPIGGQVAGCGQIQGGR